MPIVAPYPSSIIITVPIEVPIVPLEVKCQIRLFLSRARLPRTPWNGHCVHKSLSFFVTFFWSVFKARARVVTMQILLSVRELTLATPSCGNNRREWGLLAKPLRASITIVTPSSSPSSHFVSFEKLRASSYGTWIPLKLLAMFAMDISIGHWTDRILKPNPDIWPG